MIVEKFTNFAGTVSYTFPLNLMVDDYGMDRPAVVAPVSGAGGTFDFFGSNPNPVQPITVVKKFSYTAATSAAIDDERMTIIQKIASAGEGFLYLLDRDGSTRYYTYAKCIAFDAPETYQEKGRFIKNFQLTFMCRTGIWYNTTGSTSSGVNTLCYADVPLLHQQITVTLSGSLTYSGSFTISNAGYLEVPVTVTFGSPSDGTLTAASVTNSTNGATVAFSGTTDVGVYLCSDVYTAVEASLTVTNLYSNVTPGAGQVLWFWADVGTNTITYSVTVSGTAVNYIVLLWREAFNL